MAVRDLENSVSLIGTFEPPQQFSSFKLHANMSHKLRVCATTVLCRQTLKTFISFLSSQQHVTLSLCVSTCAGHSSHKCCSDKQISTTSGFRYCSQIFCLSCSKRSRGSWAAPPPNGAPNANRLAHLPSSSTLLVSSVQYWSLTERGLPFQT